MKLADLIEAARKHVITPEEHRAQVISFAYGNIAIENLLITRELVESVYDQLVPIGCLKRTAECRSGILLDFCADSSGNSQSDNS